MDNQLPLTSQLSWGFADSSFCAGCSGCGRGSSWRAELRNRELKGPSCDSAGFGLHLFHLPRCRGSISRLLFCSPASSLTFSGLIRKTPVVGQKLKSSHPLDQMHHKVYRQMFSVLRPSLPRLPHQRHSASIAPSSAPAVALEVPGSSAPPA